MAHDTVTVEKYYITGTVAEIVNTTYGNMYIEDAEGNRLYIYGTWSADGSLRFDAMESQPVVGDVIKVCSVVGNYNGAQLKNAWIISVNASDDDEFEPKLSIADALAKGEAMAHDTVTDEKYYITGTVADISNTQYGNMNIVDADGNKIYVYGTWSADGSLRFDAMDSQPKVGDVITVYTVVGNYNGAQLKNAWIVSVTSSEGGNTETEGGELSIADAIAKGESMDHNTTTSEKYYITGTVADISNTQYGNMNIVDADGNKIYVYGTWSADGSLRFDAMESQPKVGDVVKLYTVVGNFNGPQLKNAWIIEIE